MTREEAYALAVVIAEPMIEAAWVEPSDSSSYDFVQKWNQVTADILEAAFTKEPTVREAFAKAGFPVPDGAKIVHYDSGVWIYAGAELSGWIDGLGKWDKPVPATHGQWVPAYDERYIDLSNIPAKDCLEALPQVVREALEEG